MYAHIITSSLTVGLGGSAGLESPIVVTGAAFGSNYAQKYKLSYKDRTLLNRLWCCLQESQPNMHQLQEFYLRLSFYWSMLVFQRLLQL
jgi:hypothetical protein